MKEILKSLCLMLYFLTVQIIAGVVIIAYKFIFDFSWIDNTYQVMNKYGAISMEYMNCISELLYPMLIIADGGNMLQFKNISNIAVTIAASTSADITVNCSDGTLHYTNGVLDE